MASTEMLAQLVFQGARGPGRAHRQVAASTRRGFATSSAQNRVVRSSAGLPCNCGSTDFRRESFARPNEMWKAELGAQSRQLRAALSSSRARCRPDRRPVGRRNIWLDGVPKRARTRFPFRYERPGSPVTSILCCLHRQPAIGWRRRRGHDAPTGRRSVRSVERRQRATRPTDPSPSRRRVSGCMHTTRP